MEDQVTITVDGRKLVVPKGTLLWEACKANDIDIPIFCYHTKLGPVGACRTCLVEQIGNTKGPITACSTPAADGMEIRTRSPIAQKAQRGIFEFLLANHPLDCPICDRGGECPLQDQTFAYGPGTSRYVEPKRHHVKPITLGPTIALDRERCVLCWRCVRFCAEVAEDESIVLLDRGDHTVVGTAHDRPYVSNFSGNVVELCPVGALTSRKQRFSFRPWELQNQPSVCPHCPMGCNINISVRKNDEVIRFLSRDNPEVDNSWLCDRGRYGFEFINSPDRIAAPMIKRDGAFVQTSWGEALAHVAERLAEVIEMHGVESVAGVASSRLPNEDLFTFKRFMLDTLGSGAIDHFPRSETIAAPEASSANASLRDALASISELQTAKTIVLLGANPSIRAPVLELRIREAINKHGARLVIVGQADMPLSAKAATIVPCDAADLATVVRGLTAGLGAGAHDRSGAQRQALDLLAEGSFIVLYDDTFSDTMDKVDALEAVATFVTALKAHGPAGVLPLLDESNSMGARWIGVLPGGDAPSAKSTLQRPVRAALVLGADLAGADRSVRERVSELDFLVLSELFMTETAALADVILPAASFAERVGTITNLEGRVQKLFETVPAPGIARPDWEMLVDLSQHFDSPLSYGLVRDIWADMKSQVPEMAGMAFEDIGPYGTRPRVLQPV